MRLPRTRVYVEASARVASTGLFALGLGVACALSSASVAAAPGDANANDVADKVMDPDKLYSNFLVAEKRLAAALKKCGRAACSKGVKARLLRDLGVVYIVGLRQLDKGKEYLTRAVKADPDIELDQRVATPELEQLFMDAGGGLKARTAGAPPSRAEEPPEREPEPESKAEPERGPEPTPEESSSSDTASGSEEESSDAGDTDLAALDASASAEPGEEETRRWPGSSRPCATWTMRLDWSWRQRDGTPA
jgi:hypothetical protein